MIMDTDLKPLWGSPNMGNRTLLDSSKGPTVGSLINVDGITATVVNTFINEGKLYVTYRIGNEVFTKEYTSGVIYG